MTKTGLLTSDGGHRWYISTIAYLLNNEKYMGDALCQKTFASTFPFTRQMNCGERDQYYVDHSHPAAIISKEIFEKAQALLQRKGQRIDLWALWQHISPADFKSWIRLLGMPQA